MEEAVIAVAIEDRVDFMYRDLSGLGKPTKFSLTIPEDTDYCAEIHRLIDELFRKLVRSLAASPVALFNRIGSVVVSVPGVVKDHRSLLQIPLWNSTAAETPYFDFAEELCGIAQGLIKAEGKTWSAPDRAKFRGRVFVVNDATACAAFEDSRRKDEKPDFIYLKVHNGINVGIVQDSYDGTAVSAKAHPEAGHGLALLHKLDYEAGFKGVCPFHDRCYEGMIAAHSLYARIVDTRSPVFNGWKRRLDELQAQELCGQALDNALLDYVLGEDGRPAAAGGDGVDLISHYVSQLAYHMSLLAPKHIVIGGRMARSQVISAVRQKMVKFANNYPQRDELTSTGVTRHVVAGHAAKSEKDTIEVQGALAIAVLRAKGVRSQ
ncbi:ROK family protein [Paraburkholderia sp. RL18-103-BIB-C]|uniref:ROK family protein n=1 Tax=Paraburkholderia sp. RL18-103-BIB-C TaxID=3031637 RepID=UPI0038BB976D